MRRFVDMRRRSFRQTLISRLWCTVAAQQGKMLNLLEDKDNTESRMDVGDPIALSRTLVRSQDGTSDGANGSHKASLI